jgi:hypothetical protein
LPTTRVLPRELGDTAQVYRLAHKSYRFFEPAIATIAQEPNATWSIDADGYTDSTISQLIELRDWLGAAMTTTSNLDAAARVPTDTLVTKVMLGVFGSVPPFDSFFIRGFRTVTGKRVIFGHPTLAAIGEFCKASSVVIDAHRVGTLDVATGQPTRRRYTWAKVIDMVFLVEGGGR